MNKHRSPSEKHKRFPQSSCVLTVSGRRILCSTKFLPFVISYTTTEGACHDIWFDLVIVLIAQTHVTRGEHLV